MTMDSVISNISDAGGRPLASRAAVTCDSRPLSWNWRGERLTLTGSSTPRRSRTERI